MPSTFADLGVSPDLITLLDAGGIASPFPIQEATIAAALAGRDIAGRAPTGSGKTLAFGLPLAEQVKRARPARPQALILAPTRELAAQIRDDLAPLLAARKRSIAAFYGGTSYTPQLKTLRRGVDVLVACPGRLADLIARGNVILDEVATVVLDEADRMADMGFLPEVRRILDRMPADRQTLLFSATLDGDVDVLVRHYQHDPVRCDVEPPEAADDTRTHRFLQVAHQERVGLTVDLIGEHGSTVVFCRTKRGAERLAAQLSKAGIDAAALHGDRSQAQRERALAAFSSRRVQALVATDVAARGIHVDDVGCVVHFDAPADVKDYIHRSGRTGRAGASGVVVSFITDADRAKSRQLQRALGLVTEEVGTRTSAGPRPAAPRRRGRVQDTPGQRHGTPGQRQGTPGQRQGTPGQRQGTRGQGQATPGQRPRPSGRDTRRRRAS